MTTFSSFHQTGLPRRQPRYTGLLIVAALHALLIYALMSGLARKVVDVVLNPVDVQVIEEIKETPPTPPQVKPLQVTRQLAPKEPPPFTPPPEVKPQAAPVVQETISVTTPTPPPAPVPFVPSPPPQVAAPAPQAQPVSIGVACPTRVVPRIPPRLESVLGSVRVRLSIRGGKVVNVDVLSSSPRGVFDGVVRAAVQQYGCVSAGEGVTQVADQTFEFKPE